MLSLYSLQSFSICCAKKFLPVLIPSLSCPSHLYCSMSRCFSLAVWGCALSCMKTAPNDKHSSPCVLNCCTISAVSHNIWLGWLLSPVHSRHLFFVWEGLFELWWLFWRTAMHLLLGQFFCFWIFYIDPYFIPCDSLLQKSISFFTVLSKKL